MSIQNKYSQHFEYDQPLVAARLYYLDGLSQAEIARLVHASQATVSRLLALAREQGIVRISVPEYDPRHPALERQLCERFGLDLAVVIRTPSGQPIADVRRTVAYFAAPVISTMIGPSEVVAIAGGRAMQALVEKMRPSGPVPHVTIVQAMGNVDSSAGPYDALALGHLLAQRWQGSFQTVSTPAFLPDEATCRRFLELRQVQEVMKKLASASLALVGIGTLEDSVFVERRALGQKDLEALLKAGAVGEITGRFFDASGKECDTPLRKRVVSPSLRELRRIPQVVAVVAGKDRRRAIEGAIRGGLIKSLVIDEQSTQSLLGNGS